MKSLTVGSVALLASAGGAIAQADPALRLPAVESLLTAGRFDAARQAADRYVQRHPGEAAGWLLLARASVAGHTTSNLPRIQAVNAVRQAIRLDSTSLAAWTLLGQLGMVLGGADGESIAQDAWRHALKLDPGSLEAWRSWLVLYRGNKQRARMRALLAPVDSIPAVRLRIAQLLIEEERYASADSVLDGLPAGAEDACALALRAQSAFEAGDATRGYPEYARALSRADRGGECLWRQVIGIATPDEIRAWPSVRPSDRAAFLARFWAVRTPDLFVSGNARVAEHFRRLRLARERYPLLHPLNKYNRSAEGRALEAAPSIGEQLYYQRCEARVSATSPVAAYDNARSMGSDNFGGIAWNPLYDPRAATHGSAATGGYVTTTQPPGTLYLDPEFVRLLSIPHSRGIRDLDSTAVRIGYNIDTGLDDRGLALLRFGEPSQLMISSDNAEDPFCRIPDLERWRYDGVGTVRFFRPNAVFIGMMGGVGQTGDMLFRPMGPGQFETTAEVVTTDRSSVAAPLSFGFWTAQFARRQGRGADLLVVTTRGAAAAQLVGTRTDSAGPGQSDDGRVLLSAAAGRYTLLVHARVADTLGRQTGAVRLWGFGDAQTSDALLAVAWPAAEVTRDSMIARVERDLTFTIGTTVRSYLEVYGLKPEDGRLAYRVTYSVIRTSDPGRDVNRDSLAEALTLAFDREHATASSMSPEWLDISTDRLAAGWYLLRVEVRDAEGRRVGRSQIAFSLVRNH